MEVERVQDGPLKTTEISRFLEASKTSYRAVDNILTDKKESRFQQRTLIEIASETEIRNNAAKVDRAVEPLEVAKIEIESPEELEAKELNEQKLKDAEKESIRDREEKQKEESRLTQEKKDGEIHQRGFSEGKAAAELEAKKALDSGLIALENARKSMLDLNASHFINLREQIASQILTLSSERAGLAISTLPEKFFNKIESLLETVGQTTQSPVISLNSEDLESIQQGMKAQADNLGFTFKSNPNLMSGDIIIEIGSISIKDTALERSGIPSDHKPLDLASQPEELTSNVDKSDNISDQENKDEDNSKDQT